MEQDFRGLFRPARERAEALTKQIERQFRPVRERVEALTRRLANMFIEAEIKKHFERSKGGNTTSGRYPEQRRKALELYRELTEDNPGFNKSDRYDAMRSRWKAAKYQALPALPGKRDENRSMTDLLKKAREEEKARKAD